MTTHFLTWSVAKLEDFIHARKFKGKMFQRSKITPTGKKFNKVLYKSQLAESIGDDCSDGVPCLVGLALSLCAEKIVLECPSLSILDTNLPSPEFKVTYTTRVSEKCPS